jgi:tryptophan synthase alpha chain
MKNRIEETFAGLKKAGKKAFIPYIMAGDPDLDTTMERVIMLESLGADIVELGAPFSDPTADGPTIQRAAERALKSGATLRRIVGLVAEARKRSTIPLIIMTYYNPILKYGEEAFVSDASAAGVDGLIIPDLPPEEAAALIRLCRAKGVATIFLVAPTSTDERMKRIVSASKGFIYYVSMTGITGSSLSLDSHFSAHIGKLRGMTDKPVAIGFGISTPEDARRMAAVADGVIVGSAIVKKFHEDPGNAGDFVQKLREAV